MNYSNEFYMWVLNFLFVIGTLLFLVGVGFMLIPDKIFKMANKLNRSISTDGLFNKLNEPVYKERFFYRHHLFFGYVIMFSSAICFYILTFYIGIDNVTESLVKLAESEYEKWLFIILYYILIGAIALSLVFGGVLLVRPSVLKSFETWGNHWVDTDRPLKVLDKNRDLPDRILPGSPRIFGFFVTLAAIYIMWSVALS